jgi:hypothetical protein
MLPEIRRVRNGPEAPQGSGRPAAALEEVKKEE